MHAKPRQDCLIVKLDPKVEQVGSIIIPDGCSQQYRTGTVIDLGPGTQLDDGSYVPLDIEKGDKVVFLHWNLVHKNGKAIANILGEMEDDCALLRARDVLLVYPPDEQHTFG